MDARVAGLSMYVDGFAYLISNGLRLPVRPKAIIPGGPVRARYAGNSSHLVSGSHVAETVAYR